MEYDSSAYFDTIDYVIFGGMLVISAIIGIYFAFFAKKKQDNPDEYLMGGKTMGIFPIAMSLIASDISGISLMGLPSEVYAFGTLVFINVFAEALAQLFNVYMILPVLYHLKITSVYEYLELRFSTTLRKLGSLLYVIASMLYVPIVVYVPALAFSQTSGISLSILIPLLCAVCTFYTTLGGLKAVVWTDTFQTMMILVGVVAVAIVGTINIGGVSEIFRRNEESGRIEIFNMSWDVTLRQTFWTVIIGKIMSNLSFLAVNQSLVQRYIALPTIKNARIAILILVIGVSLIGSCCCYTGLVIFAAFHSCDPLSLGYVRKADGIVPYYVMKFTRHIPALPGIFMAGVFSAALSTMSTCQNSMCGVIFEDFIRPRLRKDISDAKCSFYMKIIVIIIGVITAFVASIVDKLGGVIQTNASFSSITMGTLLGIYLLGIFFPWCNSTGALVGGVIGSIVVGWISFGAQYAIGNDQIVYQMKPFSVDGCDNDTLSAYYSRLNSTISLSTIVPDDPFPVYRLTFMLYLPLGVVICIVVGMLVSWATGFQDISLVDGRLLNPYIRPYVNTKDKIDAKMEKKQQEKGKLLG